ncbi:MAG TPA: hypothetical protein VIA06_17590 [Candidatus Dormibacteraeota bacterium]|jgi:hypothetical protein|nr:hypothetical protein [Candidatus Dormibacteraeota bacterium]
MMMGNYCHRCGGDAVAAKRSGTIATLRCTACGETEETPVRPAYVVTGTGGAGKTAVSTELPRLLAGCAVYDVDLIWCGTWDERNDNWLRIAHANGLCGLDTVFCGTVLPSGVDSLPNRCLVGDLLYLDLHCTDEDRDRRLRARWQHGQPDGEEVVHRHRAFAAELLRRAPEFAPPMPVVSTSGRSVAEAAADVAAWVDGWRRDYERRPGVRQAG